MKKNRLTWLCLLVSLAFISLSCRMTVEEGLTFAKIDLTYAVESLVVQLSQTVPVADTATLAPAATQTQTYLPRPLVTHSPVFVPSLAPTSTPTRLPCDFVTFVMDVTVPQGTNFNPGDVFTKTWRLRNSGSCSWSQAYELVFVEGDRLSAPDSVRLPGEVRPLQEVDITVLMEAPDELGRYRGEWMLRNPSGQLISVQGGVPIYVTIEVVAPLSSTLFYNFADNFCAAEWFSSASGINPLPCPGERGALQGYVFVLDSPLVERNEETDDLALEMHPPMQAHPLWDLDQKGGWIRGSFPPVSIQTGSHFRAQVGCLDNVESCDVNFILQVRIPGLPWQELGLWHQEYDGELESIDIDLSEYVGLSAEFQFIVDANSSPGLDQAVWVNPRLEN